MIDFFDKDGNPLDLDTWARLYEDEDYRRIARTTIISAANPEVAYDVSTVWLGNNHAYSGGPPLIFETMVFGDGSLDLDCWRYTTEGQARRGHDDAITMVAATMDDPVIMDVDGDPKETP